jgi:hypothetical protein
MKLKLVKKSVAKAVAPKAAPVATKAAPKAKGTVPNSHLYRHNLDSKGLALTASGAWVSRRVNKAAVTTLIEKAKELASRPKAFKRMVAEGEKGVLILKTKEAVLMRKVTKIGPSLFHLPSGIVDTAVFPDDIARFVSRTNLINGLRKDGVGCKVFFKTAKKEAEGVTFGKPVKFNSMVVKSPIGWDIVDFELVTNKFNTTTRSSLVSDSLPVKGLLPAKV